MAGRKKGSKSKRASKRRFSTPPPDLCPNAEQSHKHLKTPTRSAILGAVYYAELNSNSATADTLAFAFRTTIRSVERILQEACPRR